MGVIIIKKIFVLLFLVAGFFILALSLHDEVQAWSQQKWCHYTNIFNKQCVETQRSSCKWYEADGKCPAPEPVIVGICEEDACVLSECDSDECISECKTDRECEPDPTPEPTPQPTPDPTPQPDTTCHDCAKTDAGQAPVCSDGHTSQGVANLHVLRNADKATVNFFMTAGDHATVYWRISGEGNWQHSSAITNPDGLKPNSDNFISYEVGGLNSTGDYDFGVVQSKGCGSGEYVVAVVVDGSQTRLFPFTHWEIL